MNQEDLRKHKIIQNEEIAEDVFLLSFPRTFDFEPGQVIGIGMNETGPRRLYSIASSKNESKVKILYNVVEEGYMTPKLSDLEEGDNIWITRPRGEFLYDPGPAYWIATGTGIAPFYSMLNSGLYANKVLIHGERYLERFYFYNDFSDILGRNYLRCCSGEELHDVFHGRVTDYLRQLHTLSPEMKYYLCGRAEMVVETRDILIDKGIPFDRIISEIYF